MVSNWSISSIAFASSASSLVVDGIPHSPMDQKCGVLSASRDTASSVNHKARGIIQPSRSTGPSHMAVCSCIPVRVAFREFSEKQSEEGSSIEGPFRPVLQRGVFCDHKRKPVAAVRNGVVLRVRWTRALDDLLCNKRNHECSSIMPGGYYDFAQFFFIFFNSRVFIKD